MANRGAWKRAVVRGMLLSAMGCTSPMMQPSAGIRRPYGAPELPPPAAVAAQLPEAPPAKTVTAGKPAVPSAGPLYLDNVLDSLENHFPLLYAIEQERAIASGQRLAAEGAFDTVARARESLQAGAFDNHRLDVSLEQPTPYHGVSLIGGYRFGLGDFPVYYGDRKTATGGEFRGGVQVPLLRDSGIDRRRAALRQAQILENLADPVIRRARLDYQRAAARAYWAWVAAGESYRVADALLRIARDRQSALEEQNRRGQVQEFVVIDNSRIIIEREGVLLSAERRWQQTSFELSLYLRDEAGEPVVADGRWLPPEFLTNDVPPPPTGDLNEPLQQAYSRRPELTRFNLLKERVSVDLRLAENQQLPALNLAIVGSRDVGISKSGTGVNAPDDRNIEGAMTVELPLQRREARGRQVVARGQLGQLLAQERYARDQIAADVRDAVSSLDRTYQRLDRARAEQRVALRVADLERDRFRAGQSTLLEVNLRELAAAAAQQKVVDTLAEYHRSLADFRAALGDDGRP